MDELTADRLREVVTYDPTTGAFRNACSRKKVRIGEIAGTVDKSVGYIVLCIDRRRYYGHRLAFLYMTGRWPDECVDHINGDRIDNRWANLRSVSRSINQQNMRRAMHGSSSGLLGAHRKRGRWSSQIRTVDGQLMRLGTFDTAEEAHVAYVTAKRKLHEGCAL